MTMPEHVFCVHSSFPSVPQGRGVSLWASVVEYLVSQRYKSRLLGRPFTSRIGNEFVGFCGTERIRPRGSPFGELGDIATTVFEAEGILDTSTVYSVSPSTLFT